MTTASTSSVSPSVLIPCLTKAICKTWIVSLQNVNQIAFLGERLTLHLFSFYQHSLRILQQILEQRRLSFAFLELAVSGRVQKKNKHNARLDNG
jgi:hypothetical protein